jgi:hypothetical protein
MLLVLGFELRQNLSGLHPIFQLAAVFDWPVWNPECQGYFVFASTRPANESCAPAVRKR